VNLKVSLDTDITSNLTQPQSFNFYYCKNAFSKVKKGSPVPHDKIAVKRANLAAPGGRGSGAIVSLFAKSSLTGIETTRSSFRHGTMRAGAGRRLLGPNRKSDPPTDVDINNSALVKRDQSSSVLKVPRLRRYACFGNTPPPRGASYEEN